MVANESIEKNKVSRIRKKTKISYDGKQFLIRIPKDIVNFYRLKKGDQVELFVETDIDSPEMAREIPLIVKLIEDSDD